MVARGDFLAESRRMGIPLVLWKAADLAWPAITGTEDNGDHHIALDTNTIVLRGNAPNNDTQTDISWTQVVLPPEYVGGSALSFIVSISVANGATATAISCDLSVFEVNVVTGAVSADLVTTDAQTTVAAATEYTFAITGSSLEPGAILNIKLTTISQDNTTDGQQSIWATSLLLSVRG